GVEVEADRFGAGAGELLLLRGRVIPLEDFQRRLLARRRDPADQLDQRPAQTGEDVADLRRLRVRLEAVQQRVVDVPAARAVVADALGLAALQVDRAREPRLEVRELFRLPRLLPRLLRQHAGARHLLDQVRRQLRRTVVI